MILLEKGFAISLIFVFCLDLKDLVFDKLLLILKTPLIFLSHHLLGTNGLRTVFVDLPHQVNSGQVLLAPFVFLKFPLLLTLNPCEILNQLLFGLFVFSFLKVELLQVNNFLSPSELLLLLNSLDLLFFSQGLAKHVSISLLLKPDLILSKDLLCVVMSD